MNEISSFQISGLVLYPWKVLRGHKMGTLARNEYVYVGLYKSVTIRVLNKFINLLLYHAGGR